MVKETALVVIEKVKSYIVKPITEKGGIKRIIKTIKEKFKEIIYGRKESKETKKKDKKKKSKWLS